MAGSAGQVLTFEAGGRFLAIAADEVAEVIAAPRITRVPQAPASVRGIANLRGRVVPILSVEALLGGSPGPAPSRVIVLNGAEPVGLAVDGIRALGAAVDAEPGEGAATGAARLLQRRALLDAAFAGRPPRPPRAPSAPVAAPLAAMGDSADVAFLQFDLAGQAYALPLEQVQEVTLAPPTATLLPGTEAIMLGVMPLRDALLPLISLREALGLPPRASRAGDRVIVARLGAATLGLVVDHVQTILRTSERFVGAAPAVLNRGRGEARIDALVRTPAGLVSVLATERIFLEETVIQILAEGAARGAADGQPSESAGPMEKFILFRLGAESYGLPISAVREVVRLPVAVARAPQAPDFVAGLVNHRGAVVPLIDQRRRFAVETKVPTPHSRVIVAQADDLVAGFIVDAVEQILSVPAEALSAAPDLAAGDPPLFDRIATLHLDRRLILLIDPRQLLDQAERDVVRDVTHRANAAPA